MKPTVEDDGGRGVVLRFVARFGGDVALSVTCPRFGRWRTKERRRGVEAAMYGKVYDSCLPVTLHKQKVCRLLWMRAKRRFCLFS